MNRTIRIFTVLCLAVLLSVVFLTSCQTEHKHDFGEWIVTKKNTCTEVGEQSRACSCGEKDTQKIAAKGHSYESVVTAPTCTEKGYTTHTCACGDSYVDAYVNAFGHIAGAGASCTEAQICTVCGTKMTAAKGHSYESVVTAPTCTEKGYTTHTCACGDSYVDAYVNALGHTIVTDEAIAPTCTTTGRMEGSHCDVCGEILVAQTVLEALGHMAVIDPAIAPTCTATGWTEGLHCGVCEETLVEQTVLETIGHMTMTDKAVAPTCTVSGLTEGSHCDVCGEILVAQTVLEALGHTVVIDPAITPTCTASGLTKGSHCGICNEIFVEQTVLPIEHTIVINQAVSPTCTGIGLTEGKYCGICGEIFVAQTILEPLGHTIVIDEAVAPTCTVAGRTEGSHCSECNQILVAQTVIPATEHDYSSSVLTAPTCTLAGYYTYTCVCGNYYVSEYIEPTGHCLGGETVTEEPTCDMQGVKIAYCENCDYTETTSIAPNGHDYEVIEVAPTCTENGYIKHVCFCGNSYISQYIVSTGHTFGEWVVTLEPTCTEYGEKTLTCENCGHTDKMAIMNKSHEYSETVTAPTCTEKGYTTYSCHCGYYYLTGYVSATGHSMSEWSLSQTPTCEEAGEERKSCRNCNYFETRKIAETGHNYGFEITDPSKTGDITVRYTCFACENSYEETLTPISTSVHQSNIRKLGYTGKADEHLIIPMLFLDDDGIWCRITSVASYAFNGCSNIVKITLPDTVETIGDYAFSGCSAMTEIDLPDTVKSIGDSAFSNCQSLTSISLPSALKTISSLMFNRCFGLTEITIPSSVTSIEEYAFYYCEGLKEIEIPNTVTLIEKNVFAYCSGLEKLTIPFIGNRLNNPSSDTSYLGYLFGANTYNNNPNYVPTTLKEVILTNCEQIPQNAFYDCKNITSILLPEDVTTIGQLAFHGCSGLAEFEIPSSVQTIGWAAFAGCTDLKEIVIPEGVRSISGVFQSCTSLQSIDLPESLSYVGDLTFYNCSSLTEVTINGALEYLGSDAFAYCGKLTKLTLGIGTSVQSGSKGVSEAFGSSSQNSLTTVIITGGTSIPSSFFKNCTNLKTVILPDTLTSIGAYAFSNCTALKSITIPVAVQRIGREAFWYCSALETVDIGVESQLQTIEVGGFEFCSSLKTILVPTALRAIGMWAFSGTGLTDVYYPGTTEQWNLISVGSANDSFVNATIHYKYDPNHVHTEVIDPGVAGSCLTKGLTEGKHCSSCDEVFVAQEVIPAGHKFREGENRCFVCGEKKGSEGLIFVSNGDGTCYVSDIGSCKDTDIIIPNVSPDGDLVTAIGEGAFLGQKSIISVEILKGITDICDTAFINCSALVSVKLPRGLKTIGNGSFANCTALEIVDLPETLTVLDQSSFENCAKLAIIKIPGGVEQIGMYAFGNCSSLITVEMAYGVIKIGDGAFGGCSALVNINFPNSITTIGQSAFSECENLSSIQLPESLAVMGGQAFSNCILLRSVTIPRSVQTMGQSVFWCCDNLESVTFEDGILLDEIPKQTFYNCKKLKNVYIAEGIADIGSYAFSKCSSLKQLTLPHSIAQIESNAFNFDGTIEIYYIGSEQEWYSVYKNPTGNDVLTSATVHFSENVAHIHNTEPLYGIGATCFMNGWTDGTYCVDCGAVVNKRIEIPAYGHTVQNGACTTCGFEIQDYTDTSLYASMYGYESLGKMKNGAGLQAFYRALDAVMTEFHLNTDLNPTSNIVSEFDLSEYGISFEEAETAYSFYHHDHPLYYWLANYITKAGNDSNHILTYSYPQLDRAQINAAIYSGVEQYMNHIYGLSDNYTAILAAHDLIANKVQYAYDENGEPESAIWAHSVIGYFMDMDIVCEGYARTLQLLLNFAGIENIFVVGYSGEHHAWNMVKLDDGNWYWIDLTWNDGATIKYNYFCVNDMQFVDWWDTIESEGNRTFLDNHVSYTADQKYPNLRCYDLPMRSDVKFSNDDVLEYRETFTVEGITYALVGYNTVRVVEITGEGTVVIPERVIYGGQRYQVASIGAMSENGFFFVYGCVVSSEITKLILPATVTEISTGSLDTEALKNIVVIHD